MKIRNVQLSDSEKISDLLIQLGYPSTSGFIKDQIKRLLDYPNEFLVVAADQEKILAFISIHFIPQLALEGDFARINYFSVDEDHRSIGLGEMPETFCEEIAKSRNCDRIEVHCHAGREKAHKFYYNRDI